MYSTRILDAVTCKFRQFGCRMYLVSFKVRTATIIFEVGAFCSEGVGKRGRSYFAEFMNKTKCLER
jgi:hypothetical protein